MEMAKPIEPSFAGTQPLVVTLALAGQQRRDQ
jgi:hypothetical protein